MAITTGLSPDWLEEQDIKILEESYPKWVQARRVQSFNDLVGAIGFVLTGDKKLVPRTAISRQVKPQSVTSVKAQSSLLESLWRQ